MKGKAKEAAGALVGNDDLTREGRAQQDKAESQREAAKKEAEAEKARGEAKWTKHGSVHSSSPQRQLLGVPEALIRRRALARAVSSRDDRIPCAR